MVTFLKTDFNKKVNEFLAASWNSDMGKKYGRTIHPDEIVRHYVNTEILLPSGTIGKAASLIKHGARKTTVQVVLASGEAFEWVMPEAEAEVLGWMFQEETMRKAEEAKQLEREAKELAKQKPTFDLNELKDVLKRANTMRPPPPRELMPGISLVPMPAPHGFNDKRKIEAPAKAYTLKCDCKGSYFCDHIMKSIELGNDTRDWWIEATSKTKRPPDGRIEIGVPVFEHVLHRVELAYREQESWDGGKVRNLQVFPRMSDDGQSRFYDIDSVSDHRILLDQINLLESSVTDTLDGQDTLQECLRFATSNGPISCGMQTRTLLSGTHNFGTTKRLLEWIKEAPRRGMRLRALAFCLKTYGMCYTCYSNREPTFSLVNM